MEINRRTAAENEFVVLKKVRGAASAGGSLESSLGTWHSDVCRLRNKGPCGSLSPLGRGTWDSNFPGSLSKSLAWDARCSQNLPA